VEALAIKAAVCRLRQDPAGEGLMAKLAAPRLEERLFGLLVDHYCASLRQPARQAVADTPRQNTQRPMSMVARCFAA
jgi:hypothetical protein